MITILVKKYHQRIKDGYHGKTIGHYTCFPTICTSYKVVFAQIDYNNRQHIIGGDAIDVAGSVQQNRHSRETFH